MARTYTVKVKNIAQSPRKLRLVADVIRGKNAAKAMDTLKFMNKKGAAFVYKAVKSAVANANNENSADVSSLVVSKITVDEAPTRKWGRFASRGRYSRILKRRSHLNLELTQK